MGYNVAGVYIVVMVRSRWNRAVWATAFHCKFPPQLVVGQAVTQGKESVCLRRSKRAVLKYVSRKSVNVIVRKLCQLSGDVLHVSDVICSRLKCQLSGDVLHV